MVRFPLPTMNWFQSLSYYALAGITAFASASEQSVTSIVFGSCFRQTGHHDFWAPMLDKDPDLAIFIGDNVYANKTDNLATLPGFYAMLGESHGFKTLDLHARILATWDDHDFGVNDGGVDNPDKELAEKIFETFWGIPEDHPSLSRPGVYQEYQFGPENKRLQVILFDTRFFRSPITKAPEDHPKKFRYIPDPSPENTMLGDAQWQWLAEVLKKPADLRIIASSIQVGAIEHGWEHWGNFPTERKKLFDTISASGAEGVIFISGDRHHGEISLIPTEDTGVAYPLYDITASSFNAPNRRAYPGHEPNKNRILGLNRPEENFGAIRINWDAEPATVTLSLESLSGDPFYAATVPLDLLK